MTTAADVRVALRRHYGVTGANLTDGMLAEEWSLLDEVALKTRGYVDARIDCLAVRCWSGPPRGHERVAIEIKVDRGDFRREMESGKWRAWHAIAHRFVFAFPAGLVDPADVPTECGIVAVTGRGVAWTRLPPRHEPDPLPDAVFAEVCRRLSRHEERLRRADTDDPAAAIAALREQVRLMTAQVDRADRSAAKHREHLARFLKDVGADADCVCGRPIRYHRGRHRWLHIDAAAAVPDGDRFCDPTSRNVVTGVARPAVTAAERDTVDA